MAIRVPVYIKPIPSNLPMFWANHIIFSSSDITFITCRAKFGRTRLPLIVVNCPPICCSISCWTLSVAVAVVARTGKFFGRNCTKLTILRNDGLKSWPQTEIVCASSITIIESFMWRVASIHSSFSCLSGAIYNIFTSLFLARRIASWLSSCDCSELI